MLLLPAGDSEWIYFCECLREFEEKWKKFCGIDHQCRRQQRNINKRIQLFWEYIRNVEFPVLILFWESRKCFSQSSANMWILWRIERIKETREHSTQHLHITFNSSTHSQHKKKYYIQHSPYASRNSSRFF